MERPLFIVGCPRSGTTLLQSLFDSHRDLAIPMESFLYDRVAPYIDRYGDLRSRDHLIRLFRHLLRDCLIRSWKLTESAELLASRVQKPSRAGVFLALFESYAEQHGARHWGEKTPIHIFHLEEILADFPDCVIVHLTRDGRDVAESMRRMPWGPSTPYNLGCYWARFVKAGREFAARHPEVDYLEIRYADLVADPRGTIMPILSLLGLEGQWEAKPGEVAQHYAAEHPHLQSVGQEISTDRIGRAAQFFSSHELQLIEAGCGPLLDELGYEPAFPPCPPPRMPAKIISGAQDSLMRWGRKLRQPFYLKADIELLIRSHI